jgi:hypothetical protein
MREFDVGHRAGCDCKWCVWDLDHEAANVLLSQARRVAVMTKAARDDHYARVKAADGSRAAADLVTVVNHVRRSMKKE